MPWTTDNRRHAVIDRSTVYLTDAMKAELSAKYFPRYPTKRACLLPVLHHVQHTYNWIPAAAMVEVAEFLELQPAEVMDTATFYEEYWLKPKGKYLIQVCRSLACEICGSNDLTEHLKRKLRIDFGETTADGRYTLVELECLGSCGTAPAVLINEDLLENMTAAKLDEAIAKLPENPPHPHD